MWSGKIGQIVIILWSKKSNLNSLRHLVRLTRMCFCYVFLTLFSKLAKYIFCECESKKRPQLFVALGEIDQPAASHSQAVQSAKRLDWEGGRRRKVRDDIKIPMFKSQLSKSQCSNPNYQNPNVQFKIPHFMFFQIPICLKFQHSKFQHSKCVQNSNI